MKMLIIQKQMAHKPTFSHAQNRVEAKKLSGYSNYKLQLLTLVSIWQWQKLQMMPLAMLMV